MAKHINLDGDFRLIWPLSLLRQRLIIVLRLSLKVTASSEVCAHYLERELSKTHLFQLPPRNKSKQRFLIF